MAGRILPAMLPSHGYQGFRSAPLPSGWVQMGDGWLLWWSGRQIAHVTPVKDGGVRVLRRFQSVRGDANHERIEALAGSGCLAMKVHWTPVDDTSRGAAGSGQRCFKALLQ